MPHQLAKDGAEVVVSIRTRPEGRVMRKLSRQDKQSFWVSIRTRPEGRVMREDGGLLERIERFQSAPGPRAG